VIEAMRSGVAQIRPVPQAVWLTEPVARMPVDLADPIIVDVLTGAKDVGATIDAMHLVLADLEVAYDITVEPRIWTTADLKAIAPEERSRLMHAIPILGPPPLAYLETPAERAAHTPPRSGSRSHADLDARALSLSAAIARKIARDPDVVRRARASLAQRLAAGVAPGERHALREWDQLLRALPPAKLRRFLVDPGPRATRLRQSLPFTDVLTPAEREAVMRGAADAPPKKP
jgi:hypothetical protein